MDGVIGKFNRQVAQALRVAGSRMSGSEFSEMSPRSVRKMGSDGIALVKVVEVVTSEWI